MAFKFLHRAERKSIPLGPSPNFGLAGFLGDIDSINSYSAQLTKGLSENPYVRKAVDLRARTVASLDPIIYNRKGEAIENTMHPLAALLKSPNPRQSWTEFIYDIEAHYALNGNAYIYLLRSETTSKITEMYAIPPDKVQINESHNLLDPVESYTLDLGNTRIRVAPSQVIHLHTVIGTDGLHGISPLSSAYYSIVAQTKARQCNTNILSNGAKPGMTLSTEASLSDSEFQRLKGQVSTEYGGSDKAGRTLILDNGMKATFEGMTMRDLEFSTGIVLFAREIAIALDCPPELLGDSTNKTYSNSVEANREFATHTIIPLATDLYDALTRRIAQYYSDVDRIGYDPQQIEGMKGDEAALISALNSAQDYLTVNEIRERLGYAPVDGGDNILTQMGKVPLSEVATPIEDLMQGDE